MSDHEADPTTADKDPLEAVLTSLATAPVPEALSQAAVRRVRAERHQRPSSRPMILNLAAAVVVAVLVAGAGIYALWLRNGPAAPPNGATSVVLDDPYPLPVTVVDRSGSLRGLEAVKSDDVPVFRRSATPGAYPVPGDDRAMFVAWIGNQCDERATVRIDMDVRAIEIRSVTTLNCNLMGVSRAIKLRLDRAIALDAVSVHPLQVLGTWQVTFGTPPGFDVEVNDLSGSVTGAAVGVPQAMGSDPQGVQILPTVDRSKILVSWSGGACDGPVSIEIRADARSISLEQLPSATPSRDTAPGHCRLSLITRYVALTFDHEISLADMRVVAADAPGPRDFPPSTPTPPASPITSVVLNDPYPLPLTVIDRSGTFTHVLPFNPAEGASVVGPAPGVGQMLGDDSALFLVWTGGACDDRTSVDVGVDLRTIDVVTVTGPEECEAIGLMRVAVLHFDRAVNVEAVSVRATSVVTSWSVTLQPPADLEPLIIRPLPVTIHDRSGSVVGAGGVTEAEAARYTGGSWPTPFLAADAEDESKLLLGWLGGACDAAVTIEIDQRVGAMSVRTVPQGKLDDALTRACPAIGIPRLVKLAFDRRVTASEIGVSSEAIPPPRSPPFGAPSPGAAPTPLLEPTPSSPPSDPPVEPTQTPGPTPIHIPPANAEVTIVPLKNGGPDNMQLIVSDETGSLVSARSSTWQEWEAGTDFPAGIESFRRVPGDRKTLILQWGGGGCDEVARLAIQPGPATFQFFQGPHKSCDSMGVGWYAALTFAEDVPLASLHLTWTPWHDREGPPPTPEEVPALAQRISRSLGPTVVLDTTVRNSGTESEQMLVTLGGRYRFCDDNGSCHRAIGHETMRVWMAYAGAYAQEALPVEGLP
jgi:hypothetical protein